MEAAVALIIDAFAIRDREGATIPGIHLPRPINGAEKLRGMGPPWPEPGDPVRLASYLDPFEPTRNQLRDMPQKILTLF